MITSKQQTPFPKLNNFYRDTFEKLGITIHEEKPQKWVHSLTCTSHTQLALTALAAWDEQYPYACTSCHGWGVYAYSDSVPYGSSNVSMPGEEPCPGCLEQGKCPRCGEEILITEEQLETFFDERQTCSECGWDWGSPNHTDDTQPEVPECYCWEVEPWI